jgi:hypothetical protein
MHGKGEASARHPSVGTSCDAFTSGNRTGCGPEGLAWQPLAKATTQVECGHRCAEALAELVRDASQRERDDVGTLCCFYSVEDGSVTVLAV